MAHRLPSLQSGSGLIRNRSTVMTDACAQQIADPVAPSSELLHGENIKDAQNPWEGRVSKQYPPITAMACMPGPMTGEILKHPPFGLKTGVRLAHIVQKSDDRKSLQIHIPEVVLDSTGLTGLGCPIQRTPD